MRIINLYGTWDTRKWEGASVPDILGQKMSEFDGGEIECLKQQVEYLSSIVAKLVDSNCRTDDDVLDMLEIYRWGTKP